MPISMTPYRVFDSYRSITPAFFMRHGIRLLLCDLDYTLAPKSQPEPDADLRRWLSDVRAAGVEVMILSNNRSPVRVERFCRDLGITYEGHAGKPSVKGFRRAMVRCGVTPRETAMLGDKLLTDMLGANRAGVLPLMVEPLGGLLALAVAGWVSAALPWLMSAAAGCMVCVTAQEMIPEAVEQDEPAGVVSIVLGFALMMALDVAL